MLYIHASEQFHITYTASKFSVHAGDAFSCVSGSLYYNLFTKGSIINMKRSPLQVAKSVSLLKVEPQKA